ncbi:E2F family transcription factor [Amorphus coralli]|uniref:E2F family transcription factor n=1 Tax=Amorphus coralli TaxID=340680 RepID=UPI000362E9AB|nr:E2F family transcription factor [Amorphus coralli]
MPFLPRAARPLVVFGALLAPTFVGAFSGMAAMPVGTVVDHARDTSVFEDSGNTTILIRTAGQRPGGGAHGQVPPGFDEAAASLGVTTQQLMDALGDPRRGRPDLDEAARKLGVSTGQLQAVLPAPPKR